MRSWRSRIAASVIAAGAAYVPVDVDDPDERARVVFEESAAAAVVGNDLVIAHPDGRMTVAAAATLIGGPALYRALGGREGALAAATAYSNYLFAGAVPVWIVNLQAAALRRAGADPFELGLLTGAELQRLAHGIDDGYEVMARLARRFEDHSS